jgi:hypothetical protein
MNFIKGETVWHENLKCKAKYLGKLKQRGYDKGDWHYVQLEPSGGFMETQLITKYKKQNEV